MALAIAVIEPQIPPNTGNIARLCAATETTLHLIGPLGFSIDDDEMRRAGLDYWKDVDLWLHPSWRAFRDAVARERCLYFTSHGAQSYLSAPFAENTVIVLGNEAPGMPERIRAKYPDRLYRIPMLPAVRSLNLATAAGIILYEAIRQLDWDLDRRRVPAAPTQLTHSPIETE